MEKRKNVLLFTGDSSAALRKNLSAWTDAFIAKHGDMNVATIRVGETQPSMVATELLSTPFFAECRLVIFEGVPRLRGKGAAASEDDDAPSEDNSADPTAQIEAAALSAFDSIPDSTFAIFVSETPAKVSALYKKLLTEGTVKEFAAMDEGGARIFITERLPGASPKAVQTLLDRVATNPERKRGVAIEIDDRKLRNTVEKLSLGFGDARIGEKEIDEAEPQTSNQKAYSIGDFILSGNMDSTLSILRSILEKDSPYAVLPSVISTVRKRVHIELLRQSGKTDSEIADLISATAWQIGRADRMTDPEFRAAQAAYASLVKFETDWRT